MTDTPRLSWPARLAAAAVRFRFAVLGLWSVLLVGAVVEAHGLDKLLFGSVGPMPGTESNRVEERLAQGFDSPYAQFFVVALRAEPGHDVDAAIGGLEAELGALPYVTRPARLPERDPSRAALLLGLKTASGKETEALVVPLRELLATRFGPGSGIHPYLTGQAPVGHDVVGMASKEAGRAEQRVLPLTFIALFLAFGSVGAALLPLLSGVAAVLLSLGALAFLARLMPITVYASNVITMLGLGLGIDYALFVVARVREEARAGLAPLAAAAAAARHAAPAIAISGAALIVGLLGMASAPYRESSGMGIGGVLVGVASALVALTLLPAAAAALGKWLEAPRALSQRLTGEASVKQWARLAARVVQRPWLAFGCSLAVLVTLAWPITLLELGDPEPGLLPAAMEAIQGVHELEAMGLRGDLVPLRILVEAKDGGQVLTPRRLAALAELTTRFRQDRRVASVYALVDPQNGLNRLATGLALLGPERLRQRLPEGAGALISHDGRALALTVILREDQSFKDARDYAIELRQTDWSRLQGLDARVAVGGSAAFSAEFIGAAHKTYPRVFGAVTVATLLMLAFMTRSLLIPLKAVICNTLTVVAALGATFWLYHTPGVAQALGMPGPILTVPAGIPLITYCVVFGLSMDYEVFLLSRIVEARRAGATNLEAVVAGVAASGRVITAAAVIMGIVFFGFASTPLLPIKLLGTALTLGVFLDATVVRLLLVPSAMVLAGAWNWWPGERGQIRE